LITKDEVRAVILHCLRLPRAGVFWDIGGGSGSISVEAARLCPELTIYTVEQKPEGQDNIRANIAGFNLYNIQLLAGRAPAILVNFPAPDRVFIGGSGGALAEIIGSSAKRLVAGGRLVASAVLARTAEQAPQIMKAQGLAVDVRTVAVTRQAGFGQPEKQLNPITIITGRK
jgi:precorrin-6Y C5,15-methyltransferase (decarboxylating)